MRPLPVLDLVQRGTIRLIPSARLKPPALAPLAADEQMLADLAELEGATNGRVLAEARGLTGIDPRELVFGQPNATFVNAAFTYAREGGNRFNDSTRGAWYCGFDVQTSLGEVIYHLTRELDAIGRYDSVTDYAELVADFVGLYHDVRSPDLAGEAYLCADAAIAYPAGQALARSLKADGSNGIVYPSVRRRGGTCLAAFRPALVQNLQQGGMWRVEWRGSPIPETRHMTA